MLNRLCLHWRFDRIPDGNCVLTLLPGVHIPPQLVRTAQ